MTVFEWRGFSLSNLARLQPNDWVKQSMPFSYVSVEAESLDGNSYPVQVYSDISAGTTLHRPGLGSSLTSYLLEWASGDRSSQVRWSNANTDTGNTIYHEIQLQSPQQNTEKSDQAQDGVVYYAMSTVSTLYVLPHFVLLPSTCNAPRPLFCLLATDNIAFPGMPS